MANAMLDARHEDGACRRAERSRGQRRWRQWTAEENARLSLSIPNTVRPPNRHVCSSEILRARHRGHPYLGSQHEDNLGMPLKLNLLLIAGQRRRYPSREVEGSQGRADAAYRFLLNYFWPVLATRPMVIQALLFGLPVQRFAWTILITI